MTYISFYTHLEMRDKVYERRAKKKAKEFEKERAKEWARLQKECGQKGSTDAVVIENEVQEELP